jgi:hypothetical protein
MINTASFGPSALTRAECAAMLARLADESLRTRFRPERGDGSDAMAGLQLPAGDSPHSGAGPSPRAVHCRTAARARSARGGRVRTRPEE